MMKLSLFYVGIIRIFVVFNVRIKISYGKLPYTVTRFEGLEKYYSDLQRKLQADPRTKQQPEIGVYRKWNVCRSIFHEKFNHYEHPDEVLIYPPQHETLLKKYHRNIFNDLFTAYEKKWFIMPTSTMDDVYLNLSKKRKVLADGREYSVYMFICLVWRRGSTTIRPYYISRDEYNMNEAPEGDYMAGRFIFVDIPESKVAVYALAEESPNVSLHRIPVIQDQYLSRRALHSPARTAENDPICKLDSGRRLRLCTSIFMYELIHWKFEVAVDAKCEYKRFAFWGKHPRVYKFDEWMIECHRVPEERSRVFVSRGYNNNDVFVFLTYEDDLMIHYLSSKVSVVNDRQPTCFIDDGPED